MLKPSPLPRHVRARRLLLAAAILLGLGARCDASPARLLLWTDVRGGGDIRVTVDSVPVGEITSYFSRGAPRCEATPGALLVRVTAGVHDVRAEDDVGHRWRRAVTVAASGCQRLRLGAVSSPPSDESIPADSGDGASRALAP